MPCADDKRLVAYVQGTLGREGSSQLWRHLQTCDGCRERLSRLVSADTVARFQPPEPKTITERDGPPTKLERPPPNLLVQGDQVGRYLILERLAAGGMGEVYAAYDPQLDRRVALKILRADVLAGLGAKEGRTRLLREAQAMARLAHPNVITVHDVGEIGDRIFIAMEFIDGCTLREWLHQQKRSWREVLQVFLEAGRGLAAAHHAGLMHRDFKPQNVLVGIDGRVCVLDFGLARHSDAPEPKHEVRPKVPETVTASGSGVLDTPLTQLGAIMGTPGYMSPEQLRGEPTDACTDQFSFSVALYEALYGERPFKGETLTELTEEVTSGEFPEPKDDTGVPEWLYAVARRGTAVRREDRFPSMDELLARLSVDPTVARRRKLRIGALLAASALAAAGYFVFRPVKGPPCGGEQRRLAGIWDARVKEGVHRAFTSTGAPFAEDAWSGAERALDAYAGAWVGMRREACEATHVRNEQSEEVLYLRMLCLDRQLSEARALASLFAKADRDVVAKAVIAAEALPKLSACADPTALSQTVKPPADAATAAKVEALRPRLAEARALLEGGKYERGMELARPLAMEARQSGYRPVEAEAFLALAALEEAASDYRGAEQSAHAAAWAAQASRQPEVLARAFMRLTSAVGTRDVRFEEGERWAFYSRAAAEGAPPSPLLEADLEQVLAYFYKEAGRYEEALGHAKRALALAEQLHGADHPKTAEVLENLAQTLSWMGRHEEAIVADERALSITERRLGAEHPEVARMLNSLATIEEELGRFESARAHHERALAMRERIFGPDDVTVALSCNNLGLVYNRLGRHADADRCYERAIAIVEAKLGPRHPRQAHQLHSYGDSKLEQGKNAEALELFQKALELSRPSMGDHHPGLAYYLTGIGEAHVRMGHPEKAIRPLEQALVLREREKLLPFEMGRTRSALAMALWQAQADRVRARELAKLARQDFKVTGKKASKESARLEEWIASQHVL
ncbi:MAG: serine/threonine protein kinase [Myxococcales bacterium]|nr:serine/threonine protein kinase [Myxococcales bacterium]